VKEENKTEFTKVEKYLYRYRHRDKRGDWSVKYYAVFVDRAKIARRIPLSENLQRSRNQLGELLRKNDGGFDFDAERRRREEAKKKAEREMSFRNSGRSTSRARCD
jgi:hypothetical protein